ncbi:MULTISPECIES: siderophore-interacting protein [Chromobacterium]|uniref:Siderophore-interacting protein n=1 Tax=Chromobacterium rhizoryzae TaxID=1778675 RepID=A0AAD0RWR3_9NEIS|nr:MULTISPECIES: siderophore-interacting protein [Chromobacterium]AXT45943.1 siderophore-interacting protein [Chromobacterium rhizoryzae]MDH0344301.1 siderophore-interacting protein [Chromobacterium haemolyticum]BBH12296.1 siderophore-interacting protein [Chromobacterium haemolyticum]
MTTPELTVQRLRHPLRFRLLQVRAIRSLGPKLLRVTLGGEELAGFTTASFDDHLKVFFPEHPDAKPALPALVDETLIYPEGQPRPTARDYTPCRFDPERLELDLEFVLHDAGPATSWAAQAKPGQYLGIGGPRGSLVIPAAFDWHLLIGDESALPAIRRRLAELPPAAKVIALLQTSEADQRCELPEHPNADVRWVHQDAEAAEPALLAALKPLTLPAGEGFVWAAGEYHAIRAVRQHLREERGIDKSRIRAASYWREGKAASHETLED